MAEGAMTAILTSISEFFTQSIAWFGDILDVVTDNPVLLIMVIAMPICGYAVSLLQRLIRL